MSTRLFIFSLRNAGGTKKYVAIQSIVQQYFRKLKTINYVVFILYADVVKM